MTYTIKTQPTVCGNRYYVRCDGRLIQGGYASQTAAQDHINRMKFFERVAKAQSQMRGPNHTPRQERRA